MPITPLHTADILQQATGASNAASSIEVSLPAGTQSGKTVVILVMAGSMLNTPSGFTLDEAAVHGSLDSAVYVFRKSNTSAGEGLSGSTGWTITTNGGGSTAWTWWVIEANRLDLVSPKVTSSASSAVAGNSPDSHDTGTGSGVLTRNDTMVLGLVGTRTDMSKANFDTFTISGPYMPAGSDSYTPLPEVRTTNASGVNIAMLRAISFPFPKGDQQRFFAEFLNRTGTSGNDTDVDLGILVAYSSENSGSPDPLVFHTGFEFGHHGGLTASPLAARQIASSTAGTWGTNFLVQAASARSGSYGLRIVQSGAAAYVRWDINKLGSTQDDCTVGVPIKIVSVTTDPAVILEINPAAGVPLQLVYSTATSKLGLRWGSGGTPAWQLGTTSIGTWAWVDIVADGLHATGRSGQWFCEEGGHMVEQDSPADLTGQTVGGLSSVNLGANVAQTVTVDFDDLCISTSAANYPLGKTKVVLLTVDPADVTLTGTSSHFNTFSNNGTLAAWDAAVAAAAIDEVPPTVSASADGFAQVTAGSTTVTIGFTTYTLAAGEYFRGVAFLYALWANSSQTATIALDINGADLLTTATSFNPGNAPTAYSATAPYWVQGRRVSANSAGWTQALINALGTAVGNSSDATPDIGVSAIYAEVAVAEALPSTRIYGPDSDGMTIDVTRSATNYAVQTYEVTTGPSRGVTIKHWKDGVETATPIAASTTTTITVSSLYLDHVPQVTVELGGA